MKPDLRCYYHPGREATSQCDRCGDYLCEDCVHEHDELHVCARCLEDVTPREEIGKSAKIACVINALACSFWLVVLLENVLRRLGLPPSVMDTLAAISMTISALAVLLAVSDMRGRAGGELFFRWSVVISAGGSALLIAVVLALRPFFGFSVGILTFIGGCLVLQMASIVLLAASAFKGAKPAWAVAVALLAPLMFGAFLLYVLVEENF